MRASSDRIAEMGLKRGFEVGLQGRHVEGAVPFGYVRSPATRKLEPDPERARVVRRIFTDAKDGLGPGPIARRLNAEQVPGPRGKGWSRQAVTLLLRNRVYLGELARVRKAHEPLVSTRLWHAAQRDRSCQ